MEETIAAIATAYGEGGIGIVRISGEKSLDILNQIFRSVKKHRKKGGFSKNKEFFLPDSVGETFGMPIVNRQLTYGIIVDPDTGQQIDEVLAVSMKAPYTYTMEDVVEINCHGSIVALRNVLALCLKYGARLAEPGEFTKRAFLNGRIDLSQAEAVIDLIRAKTNKSFDVALEQMKGSLSFKIKELRNKLMDVLVQVTVNLDYPDEDIEEMSYETLIDSLSQISDEINVLLCSADTGRIIKEGMAVTIVGRPNVGKSSLMNAFLKESRAIVTEIPGTTRDTIEEVLSLSGIAIKLTDTAGIRKTKDKIEQIGIEKSKEAVNKADLILFMLSGNEDFTEEDLEIIPYLDEKKTIVILNKRDLGMVLTKEKVAEKLPGAFLMEASMKEGLGLEVLEDKIKKMVYGGAVFQGESVMVTNVRHSELLRKAENEIKEALEMSKGREALDFIEINVKQAFDYLGEIIGETASDQIINEVFSRFCLGK